MYNWEEVYKANRKMEGDENILLTVILAPWVIILLPLIFPIFIIYALVDTWKNYDRKYDKDFKIKF